MWVTFIPLKLFTYRFRNTSLVLIYLIRADLRLFNGSQKFFLWLFNNGYQLLFFILKQRLLKLLIVLKVIKWIQTGIIMKLCLIITHINLLLNKPIVICFLLIFSLWLLIFFKSYRFNGFSFRFGVKDWVIKSSAVFRNDYAFLVLDVGSLKITLVFVLLYLVQISFNY